MISSSTPFAPFEQDDAFRRLASLLRGERPPIVLIGAGASVKSGYPTWLQLLQSLQKAVDKKTKAEQWKKNLSDLNDAPWTAEVFARELRPARLRRLIRQQFGQRGPVAEPHLALAKMRFRHFLTTNFDPCIEMALRAAGRGHKVISWRETAKLSEFLINIGHPKVVPRVIYLHGRYDDDDVVLTESAYVSRYIASDDARRKLMAIFMTHPVVFVGFSMNDPDLANLMREVTARLQTKKLSHYAIMSYQSAADRESTRARMEGKFGVRPVFFSRTSNAPNGDDYTNLVPLLEALAGRRLGSKKTHASRSMPAEFDPEDPHRGHFGGLHRHAGRVITVERLGGSQKRNYLRLALFVSPTRGAPPITGEVKFHLHPTFEPPVELATPVNGSAVLKIRSFGAFTVGVEIEGEPTKLEIDLAALSDLPMWFRRQ